MKPVIRTTRLKRCRDIKMNPVGKGNRRVKRTALPKMQVDLHIEGEDFQSA